MKNQKGLAQLLAIGLIIGVTVVLLASVSLWQNSVDTEIEVNNNITTNTKVNNSIIKSDDIPADTLEIANDYIIARTGNDFYGKYISFSIGRFYDKTDSCPDHLDHCKQPYYHLTYSFKRPDSGSASISINIDEKNIIYGNEFGIPNCLDDIVNCQFPIKTNAQAEEIARQAGLQPGIAEWEIRYGNAREELGYVVTVKNLLVEGDKKSNGRVVYIDANTGQVIKIEEWDNEIFD